MNCSLPGSSAMGFPRQEYWSRLPFPSPEDPSNPGIEPGSPELQANSLPSEPLGRLLLRRTVLPLLCFLPTDYM